MYDTCLTGVADDHPTHATLKLVDQADDRLFCFGESMFGLNIGGTHAGGVVDQKDKPLTGELGSLPARPQQGQDRQRDHQ